MAKFTYNLPDELVKQLSRLARVDEIAPKMLDEAAPILKSSIENSLKSVTTGGTGKMILSIKRGKARKGKDNNYFLQVYPTGVDENGVRNMAKAAYKQYGTSKQPPRPWVENAMNNAQSAIYNKMQEVYNREANK